MAIWTRLFRGRGKSTAGVAAYPNFPALGSSHAATGLLVNQASAMQVSAVYTCVKIISEDVAKLRPALFRKGKDGKRVPVTDHPVAQLLRRPNSQQSWFDFCQQLTASVLLRGNGYAPVLRDSRGKPQQWIPVNPDRVIVLEAVDGSIFYQVARYGLWELSVLEPLPLAVPQEDCFHLKSIGSTALLGASPITLMREAIGLSLAQEQHASRLFGNGARPAGVLSTDQKLTEEAAKRLKKQWDDLHGGVLNHGKTAVLEQGLKWQQISLSSVDAEFLAQRRFQVEEIARIYRVAPHKLQVPQAGAGRNVEQLSLEHLTDTLAPYLEMWEQTLDRTFELEEQGIFVEFDTTKFLRGDLLSRYQAYRLAIVTGWMTQNEPRRLEGFDPIPGGDVLLRPMNTQPMGEGAPGSAGPGSDTTGAPAPGGDGDALGGIDPARN
jgi:HK97 family phage portal protein